MNIPELGVGLVYWPGLDPLLDEVDLIEIEPQSYWHEYRADDAALEMLRNIPLRKIIHGVGFPVGGSFLPDPLHIPPLVGVARALEAAWASEHLGFNRVNGPAGIFNTGFVLPPIQTGKGVDAAVSNILMMKSELGIPFAFETTANYLEPLEGEMRDGEFAAEIAERADCGILLDLHNIWANELNGRQTVKEFLSDLPLDRVWEVHLAGGFMREGFWLDAHSGEIPAPVLEIAEDVIPRLPNLGAIVFEMLPFFLALSGTDLVRRQLDAMRGLWERSRSRLPDSSHRMRERREADISPQQWEHALAALVSGRDPETGLEKKLAREDGVRLLRHLAEEFRAGMVVDALKLTSRLLLLERGEEGFREILARFWKDTSPALFESSEAESFGAWLKRENLEIPHLREVLDFELAVIRSLITRKNQITMFDHEPEAVIEALRAGTLPKSPMKGVFEVEVTI